MKIKRLVLKNFLSFKDASINLGGRRLALILGLNNDTTSMDSNGSGKSVLFEGIVWGLFGVTFRGLKGDKVVNTRAKKNCQVGLALSVNGSEVAITRYRKHSVHKDNLILEIDGQEQKRMTPTETQELLEDTIRMDYATFMNTSVFPEGAFAYLASMVNESDKKDLLESVAGMMSFDKYLAGAKLKLSSLRDNLEKGKRDGDLAGEALSINQGKLADCRRRDADFEREKQERLGALEDKISRVRDFEINQNAPSDSEINELKKSIATKKGSLENLRIDDETMKGLFDTRQKGATEISPLAAEKGRLRKETEKLRALEPGSKCPVCLQPIKDVSKHVQELDGQLQSVIAELEGALAREKIVRGDLEMAENKRAAYNRVGEEIRDEESRLETMKTSQMEIAMGRKEGQARLEVLEKNKLDLAAEKSPYGEMVAAAADEISKQEAVIRDIEKSLAALEEKEEYLKFWEVGFGDRGLKSFLLDSVVQQLNEQANHYLAYLTDGEIRVSISTRTILKGGGEREKLNVKVYSKDGMQEYLGSSGGERRRVDLSMLLALRELAKTRLEQTFDLLFVDEVFDKVDKSGIERVIHLLAQQTDDSVFVISHDSSLMDAFEEVITVEKTDKLSKIV